MMDEGGESHRKTLAREFLDYSRPSVGKPCGNDCLRLYLLCDHQKLYEECEDGRGSCALTVKGNPKRESYLEK